MDFTYSEEQQMLADSLRRFIDTEYTFEARRKSARAQAQAWIAGCGTSSLKWACWA